MRQLICHCEESRFIGTTKQSYPIRLFEKGSTPPFMAETDWAMLL
jgi:hypothetical protein